MIRAYEAGLVTLEEARVDLKALGTLTIYDAVAGGTVVCTGVSLQKVPDRTFDRTGTNLTYTLLSNTIHIGGFMRTITKDIQLNIDGNSVNFRLTKPDAFSGVEILRLLLRLQGEPPATAGGGCFAGGEVNRSKRVPQCGVAPTEVAEAAGAERSYTVLDLITSLSSDELRSVMTSCLNHTEVLLPAGPHPVMTGSEWGYPELKHDTVSCMKLVLEEITWALEGFFGEGGPDSQPADATTPRPSARTSTVSSSSR